MSKSTDAVRGLEKVVKEFRAQVSESISARVVKAITADYASKTVQRELKNVQEWKPNPAAPQMAADGKRAAVQALSDALFTTSSERGAKNV